MQRTAARRVLSSLLRLQLSRTVAREALLELMERTLDRHGLAGDDALDRRLVEREAELAQHARVQRIPIIPAPPRAGDASRDARA